MTSKTENFSLLQWIQDQGSSGTDQYFEYIIAIGDKNEFGIRIKGGELGGSEPSEMLENLADYDKLNIQLFEGQDLEPRSLDNLEIWKMIAVPIFPDIDYRFSGQSWAQNWQITKSVMGITNTVSYLIVSPDTVCDIVRCCQKLVGLKAFW